MTTDRTNLDAWQPPTIPTTSLRRVVGRLAEVVRYNELLVVYGPIGAGKSFAADHAARRHTDQSIVPLRLPHADRGRGLYRSLLKQLAGADLPKGATESQLRGELTYIVQEQPSIVLVDEAQRLSPTAQDALQNLIDVPGTRTTFVLIGNQTVPERIIPELWSRAAAKVDFDLISDAEASTVLPALHPIVAATPPEVLAALNHDHTAGQMRRWIQLTRRAILLGRTELGPDDDLTQDW